MDRYNGFETWSEVAADVGLDEKALSALLFPVCPRKGVSRIDAGEVHPLQPLREV